MNRFACSRAPQNLYTQLTGTLTDLLRPKANIMADVSAFKGLHKGLQKRKGN
jgi:hypothetical protein